MDKLEAFLAIQVPVNLSTIVAFIAIMVGLFQIAETIAGELHGRSKTRQWFSIITIIGAGISIFMEYI